MTKTTRILALLAVAIAPMAQAAGYDDRIDCRLEQNREDPACLALPPVTGSTGAGSLNGGALIALGAGAIALGLLSGGGNGAVNCTTDDC